ncbi:MAG: DEAD/DEAH box helicase [Alphaproteobacteria bacterium]|nr:DEAD/DEAH box helicase [Alphaproteobacteria bacterium]
MSFESLGLSPTLLSAVKDAGYATATPIQSEGIPIVLQGRDMLGCAQTGTGKTACFVLPMIDMLSAGRARARMPRSLIMSPTRELAAQTAEAFASLGRHHRLTTALLIGGVSYGDQEKALDRGVDVLIATPGRLLDHFDRGRILLHGVQVLVVDEADRMLDMGFIPDLERIASLVPKMRQTLMFSATMPPEIRRLADKFLINPREISVSPPASPASTIQHNLVHVAPKQKTDTLWRLLHAEGVKNALIFCNRKRDVDSLYRVLKKRGAAVAALHGDLDQATRTETLDRFKRGEIAFMVASDVAGRGIDVEQLSHVVNYDVPMHAEDYVHRIGRTGRAGLSGIAITLATSDDARYLQAIEKLIGRSIPTLDLDGTAEPDAAPSAPVPAPAPAAEDAAPAPERSRSRSRARGAREGGKRAAPAAPERATKRERPAERQQRPRERTESEGPVVGLGAHVPAFLLRPLRRAEPTKDEVGDEAAA